MGILFSISHGRLRKANNRAAEALKAAQSANDQLQAANEEITRLYEKTRELDDLKTQFFANISHELRTPLALIMGPVAKRLAATDITDAERRDMEVVDRNARLLFRHVSDLLDVAKIEAGKMVMRYAEVDLAWLTRFVASHFEVLAGEKQIRYLVEAPQTLPAQIDAEKCQRILLNLLSNAFKFTPDGGAVALSLHSEGQKAILRAQDNGPGVPAGMREVVFDRFRQIEGGPERRYGGTGLGLAIVKEFTQMHGGSIAVTDAPGGGALFTVELSLLAPAGTEIQGRAGALDKEKNRQALDELLPPSTVIVPRTVESDAPLVLIVEDNPDMAAYLANALGKHYRVAGAGNGREGLERALALSPDLILSDVMMPGMSGDEMALALRAQPEMADVPIVMLTAKADDALQVKLIQAGVQEYLTKPFSLDDLLARVGGLLASRRRSAEQLRASETRFEATFEQAAVGIALVAPDWRWLRVNRKLCEITGFTPEELLRKSFRDITHPDDLEADLDYVKQMLAHKIDTYTMEKRYLRKDGGIVWINLTVALVWKPDGSPDFFILVIENIQARKSAEDELKRRNEELERFDRATVGREMQMISLKKRVNLLSQELGREPPFPLEFIE